MLSTSGVTDNHFRGMIIMSNDTTSPLKRCAKCGEEKPFTEYHRNKLRKDGFHGDCKQCRSKAKPCDIPPPDGYKRCTKCKNELLATVEFFVVAKIGLSWWCKDCLREYQQQYRDRDREGYNTAVRNRRREKGDEYNAYQRQYRKDNAVRIRERDRLYHAKNPQIKLAKNRRYRARHRDVKIIQGARRRALKRNLPDTLTAQEWQACLAYFNNRCAVCNCPAGLWHTIAADHWIPLADPNCPGTIARNIIPLCHARYGGTQCCNNLKQDTPPNEWLIARYGKKKAEIIIKRVNDYFNSLPNP